MIRISHSSRRRHQGAGSQRAESAVVPLSKRRKAREPAGGDVPQGGEQERGPAGPRGPARQGQAAARQGHAPLRQHLGPVARHTPRYHSTRPSCCPPRPCAAPPAPRACRSSYTQVPLDKAKLLPAKAMRRSASTSGLSLVIHPGTTRQGQAAARQGHAPLRQHLGPVARHTPRYHSTRPSCCPPRPCAAPPAPRACRSSYTQVPLDKAKLLPAKAMRRSASTSGLSLVIHPAEDGGVGGSGGGAASPCAGNTSSTNSSRDSSPCRDPPSPFALANHSLIQSSKPPIVVRRGPRGFGFTIHTVRVYYGDSDYYTMHHLVSAVSEQGAAWAAGLRAGDLITQLNGESVQGLLHTQ
ncbi:hypothetical protein ACJJTC_005490, partial [Scirpophaga incertulas]